MTIRPGVPESAYVRKGRKENGDLDGISAVRRSLKKRIQPN